MEIFEFEIFYIIVFCYFLSEFVRVDEKICFIVVESFLGFVELFIMGVLKKYFLGVVNLFLEIIYEGKIVIFNFLVKEYLDVGVYV